MDNTNIQEESQVSLEHSEGQVSDAVQSGGKCDSPFTLKVGQHWFDKYGSEWEVTEVVNDGREGYFMDLFTWDPVRAEYMRHQWWHVKTVAEHDEAKALAANPTPGIEPPQTDAVDASSHQKEAE